MDAGVKFVLDNIEKTLDIIESNEEYHNLKGKVISEYNRVK